MGSGLYPFLAYPSRNNPRGSDLSADHKTAGSSSAKVWLSGELGKGCENHLKSGGIIRIIL